MVHFARLATAVAVLAAGCSSGVCRTISADAGDDRAVTVGTLVMLSAEGTTSTDRRSLSYSWKLVSRPAGSATSLDPAGGQGYFTSLVPDVPGDYTVRLRVLGSCTSDAMVTVTASPTEPVVAIPSALYGNLGKPVTLDASGSHEVGGGAVSFAWTLTAKPEGSVAALADERKGVVRLAADKEGVYTVHLVVTGAKEVSRDITVTVWRALDPVTFRPIDAEYDRPLDRVVAVSDKPPALHLYEAAAGQDEVIALPVAPTCVSVSPDGKAAAVGHDTWVSFVDLEAKTVVKTWPTTIPAGDVVATDPLTLADHTSRIAYLFPHREYYARIHAIDASNGGEIAGSGDQRVYEGGRFRLQPGSSHLFHITLNLSPQSLFRWDFDPATGALAPGGQALNAWRYPIGSNLWVSEDGAQILVAAGTRFSTSDMTYSGEMTLAAHAALAWADAPAAPSAAEGKWLVQPTGDAWASPDDTNDLSLWTYDAQDLANPEQTELPKLGLGAVAHPLHGRYVFFDKAGTKKISVAQIDADAGVLDDFVILTF
ncbi:MAG TPA: hypothetical protein VGK67_29940 [Myxococcales bacterium]|jgi:hypothetical protein